MDFRYFLNQNQQVIHCIQTWTQAYITSLHSDSDSVSEIEVVYYEVKFCSIYRINRNSITVDCQTVVNYLVKDEGLLYTTRVCFWLDGHFGAGGLLVYNYRTVQPLGLESYFTQRLDLIPYMSKEEYEKASSMMIDLYYPEFAQAENTLKQVDARKIAERLGLTIIFLHLSEVNENQRAMVKFDSEPIDVFDIDTGEIYEYIPNIGDLIVDSRLNDENRIGELNNAILHECVHWEFHWQHFEFKKILSEYYGSPKLIPLNTVNADPERAMEAQAKGIAPRILMPKDSVEKIVINTMGEYSHLGFSNVTEVTVLADSVRKVAEHFNASKQSAKIRLEELGFSGNSSVYNYIDGSYVPNYISSSHDITPIRQTYNIGFTELISLVSTDQDLSQLLLSGQYVYADSFVCLNDSRFVEVGPFGRLVLTEEALNDVSACCLSFSFEYVRFYTGLSHLYDYTLFKLTDVDYGRVLNGFSQSADVLDIREEANSLDSFNTYIQEIVAENNEIVGHLYDFSLTFEEVVSAIVDCRGYGNAEFMAQTNLHRNFLNRLRQFQNKNYEEVTLLKLFVGLKIPAVHMDRFFAIAGKSINPVDKKMTHIRQILSIYHGIDIDRFEKLVKQIPA